ncbi:MAG: glycosyltransferase family 9 protein [Acidobacteria bacterium]|nr:glycosyltransferase family 9 protein [Acidobacteriota bacterium]MDW7984034.1 glycosyltransferase family 9 protein [Acidobacteriota bacterium]
MRVLWVRLRSLGDILLNLPALDAFKQIQPDAHVTYVVHPEFVELLEDYPTIDGLATVSRESRGYLRVLFRTDTWLRESYDWVINFHGGTLSAFITLWTHSKGKVGLERFRFRSVYTHTVNDQIIGRPLHTVEVQARLLYPIVGAIPRESLRKPVFPAVQQPPRPRVRSLLEWLQGRPFVLVHPGARFRYKRWPYERTLTLLSRWLRQWPNLAFGLFMGPTEQDLPPQARTFPLDRVTVLDRWPLTDVVQLLTYTDLYVGFDNGITHLAALLDRPIVVVWGPIDPTRWAPWTDLQIRLHHPSQRVDAVPDEALTQAVRLMLGATLYGTDRFRHITMPST